MTETEQEQNEAVQQLRAELGDQGVELKTEYLIQFLIARSWNIKAAKEQLENTLAWRKESNVDVHPVATLDNKLPLLYPVRGFSCLPDGNLDVHPSVSEAVLRIYRWMGGSCLHKTDNDGCPIYIERLGHHAAKEIAKYATSEEVSHYHIGCNEFLHRVIMKDCSKKAGKIINRETVIFDCTGMGWHQFHMPALYYIRAISDTDQKYYPETLNKLYLVNAPSAFVMVWKIVKGWLDPGTIDKIQILGKDYKDVLLKQIPAENLPTFLGGECTCSHMPGGCVPSQILKNIPYMEPKEYNQNVPTAYNTETMEKGKTDELIRGPLFFQPAK
ncbi:CRAL-TRIO domain-containing protein [Zychaea mexicana]|uniref:CRAL-TRIO domain-containing protein n=1 Tax=Zychaea mexicana TaxID=64656 RepID=UPI0022FDB12F|nr:CRAL-TRIO domain-containing protein [Zychaea mexicana]KAI9496667.1 CRAL-TRIO domain-containing protein [Zychaea mexicana]